MKPLRSKVHKETYRLKCDDGRSFNVSLNRVQHTVHLTKVIFRNGTLVWVNPIDESPSELEVDGDVLLAILAADEVDAVGTVIQLAVDYLFKKLKEESIRVTCASIRLERAGERRRVTWVTS